MKRFDMKLTIPLFLSVSIGMAIGVLGTKWVLVDGCERTLTRELVNQAGTLVSALNLIRQDRPQEARELLDIEAEALRYILESRVLEGSDAESHQQALNQIDSYQKRFDLRYEKDGVPQLRLE